MWSLLATMYLFRQVDCLPTLEPSASIISVATRAESGSDATCVCDDRSLWDIIWSCLATIFACSWVAVHPNIPAVKTSWLRCALTRVELMIWTVIAPEAMILWAIRQWLGARTLSRQHQAHGWTMTHAHFLQMGGFALHRSPERGGDFLGVLSPEGLEYLSSKNRIIFPSITSEDIKDRSKGDSLSKSIALGQTSWFLAQCVTRPVQGLVTTELELVTLAFAALNGFMYLFWWYKPLDVAVQVPVYLSDPKDDAGSDARMAELEEKRRKEASDKLTFTSMLKVILTYPFRRLSDMSDATSSWHSVRILPGATHVPTYYACSMSILRTGNAVTCASLIGVLFGAIHVAGWEFAFQTRAERIAWRTASLVIISVPSVMVPLQVVSAREWKNRKVEDVLEIISAVPAAFVAYLGVPGYIIARITILVLAFMELRNLPDSALKGIDWTSFLPHV